MLSTNAIPFQVGATEQSGYKQLNFSVSTELMEYQVAGMPIDPQHRVMVAQDSNGSPLVFSIGTNGAFYVILRDEGSSTGWQQIDLRAGLLQVDATLGANAEADAFAISQDEDGTMRIAVAIRAQNTKSTNNQLFITGELSNDPTQTDWSNLGSKWVARPDNLGGVKIEKIMIGTNDDGRGAPTVLVIANQNGEDKRYFVNANFTDKTWAWSAYPIPQNADHVIDVAVATYGGLRGTWALYMVGKTKVLLFTSIKTTKVPQPINVQIKSVPAGATVLGTLNGQSGNSDLYVGGEGVYLFQAQTKPPQAITIADALEAPGVTEMILAQDDDNISIWAMSSQEELLYIQGKQSDTTAFTTPVSLFDNVSQIAAMRSLRHKGNEIIVVTNDSKLDHLWQDETTSLWNSAEIAVHSTDDMLTYTAYTTNLTVQDEQGNAVQDIEFNISSSSLAYVMINDRSHVLDPDHPITLTPNEMGMFVIMNKVTDMSSPTFHVTSDALVTSFDLNPSAGLNQQLNAMNSDHLLGATYDQGDKKGQKVLQGSYADRDNADAASQVLGQLTSLAAVTIGDGQGVNVRAADAPSIAATTTATSGASDKIDTSKLPADYAWGFSKEGSKVTYHESKSAKDQIEDFFTQNPVVSCVGHLIEHLKKKGVQAASRFFIHLKDDVLEFFVDLGDTIWNAVLDGLEQLGKLLNRWVKDLLGIDLAEILAWLGFMFNWDDILATKKHLETNIRPLFEFDVDFKSKMNQYVNQLFDHASLQLLNMKPQGESYTTTPVVELSSSTDTAIGALDTVGDVYSKISDFMSDSPVGKWAHKYLLKDDLFNLEADKSTSGSDTGLSTFMDTLEKHQDELMTIISDLADAQTQGTLTTDQIMEKIGGDVLQDVLQAMRVYMLNYVQEIADYLPNLLASFDKKIDIPVLSPLYKWVTGSNMSLFDCLMLFSAVPTTVGYKLVVGKAPFKKGDELSIDILGTVSRELDKAFADEQTTSVAAQTAATTETQDAATMRVQSDATAVNFLSADTSEVYSLTGNTTSDAGSTDTDSGESDSELIRYGSYFSSLLYVTASSLSTLVGLMETKKKEAVKKSDGTAEQKDAQLAEISMGYSKIRIGLDLFLIASSIPFSDNGSSYRYQIFITLGEIAKLIMDIIFYKFGDQNSKAVELYPLVGLASKAFEFGMEVPIFLSDLDQAQDSGNEASKTDAKLKISQHASSLASEMVLTFADLAHLKGKVLWTAMGVSGAAQVFSEGFNVGRLVQNVENHKTHYNF